MKRILLIIFGITTFVACNKESVNHFPELIHNDLEYKLNLPDTVILNKPYKVTIEFKSEFDKIIDAVQINPHDSLKTRVITFFTYKPFKESIKNKESILIDSTYVVNKQFEIDSIIFKEKGVFYFYGFIHDRIMYNHFNQKGIRDSVSFDRKKQQIFKKVVVIE